MVGIVAAVDHSHMGKTGFVVQIRPLIGRGRCFWRMPPPKGRREKGGRVILRFISGTKNGPHAAEIPLCRAVNSGPPGNDLLVPTFITSCN